MRFRLQWVDVFARDACIRPEWGSDVIAQGRVKRWYIAERRPGLQGTYGLQP